MADGSLGNGKKWAILLTVYHGQYGGVAAGRWQTGDEIQRCGTRGEEEPAVDAGDQPGPGAWACVGCR